MKRPLLLAGGILATALLAAPPAFAQPQTVSAGAGPVSVPNVPVQVCVQSACQTTPALSNVWLTVRAFAEATPVPPRFTSSSCPSGMGVAIVVTGGSSTAIVTGLVDGIVPTGSRYQQPIGAPVVLPAGATMTVSACASWMDVLVAPFGAGTLLSFI